MRTMHGLYYQAVDSMELEHVNHFEREGVLPIAFSLFHYTNMHDGAFMMLSGQLPIWNEDWQARVQMAIDDAGKERPVSDMIHQRIGDYDAFKEYQRTVFDRTEAHIAAMDPADFQRVLVAPPYPPQIASTYSAMCAGPAGITVLDGYECWLYQHGLRHMGEIELARGLVGLERNDLVSDHDPHRRRARSLAAVCRRALPGRRLYCSWRSIAIEVAVIAAWAAGAMPLLARRCSSTALRATASTRWSTTRCTDPISNRDPKYARWDTICGNIAGQLILLSFCRPPVEPPAPSRPHQHRSGP